MDGSMRDGAWYSLHVGDLRRRFPRLRVAIIHVSVVCDLSSEKTKKNPSICLQKSVQSQERLLTLSANTPARMWILVYSGHLTSDDITLAGKNKVALHLQCSSSSRRYTVFPSNKPGAFARGGYLRYQGYQGYQVGGRYQGGRYSRYQVRFFLKIKECKELTASRTSPILETELCGNIPI